MFLYIGCLNIHGTHVNANNSTNNNVVFFFVSYLKKSILYQLLILDQTAVNKREKYFASLLIWRQNYSKLSQNGYNPLI